MANFVSLARMLHGKAQETAARVVLDKSDRAILSELAKNARVSYRDLSKVAHLSPNACAERVRRLQTLGVVKGFAVDIDPSSIGLSIQAFVDVKLQRGSTMDDFERAVTSIAGVAEAVSMTGAFDARLRIVCRDPQQLGELIEELRAQTGIQETSSTVIVRQLRLKLGN